MSESPLDDAKEKLDIFKKAEKSLHLDSQSFLDVPWWDLIRMSRILHILEIKMEAVRKRDLVDYLV